MPYAGGSGINSRAMGWRAPLVAGTAEEQQPTTIESEVQGAQMPQSHPHVLCCVGFMLEDSRRFGCCITPISTAVGALLRPRILAGVLSPSPYTVDLLSLKCLTCHLQGVCPVVQPVGGRGSDINTSITAAPQELQAQLGEAQKTVDSHLFKNPT